MIRAGGGGVPERRRAHGAPSKAVVSARRRELAQQTVTFNAFMKTELAKHAAGKSSIMPHLKAFGAEIKRPKPNKIIIQAAKEAIKEMSDEVVRGLEVIRTFKTAVTNSGVSGKELSGIYASIGLISDVKQAEKIIADMTASLTRKLQIRSTALLQIETWEKTHRK